MGKIRYIGSGDPTEDLSTTAFGETFEKGRWHKLTPELEVLAANPMFEVTDPLDHDGDGKKGGSLPKEHVHEPADYEIDKAPAQPKPAPKPKKGE